MAHGGQVGRGNEHMSLMFDAPLDAHVRTTAFDLPQFWARRGGAGEYVASFDPVARESARRRLEATLPRTPEGMIALPARARGLGGPPDEHRLRWS